MNILPLVNTMFSILLIMFASSCGLMSQERHVNTITTTQSIFLDSNERAIFISIDSTVPNLKYSVTDFLKKDGANIVASHNNANIILKIKTKFHGKIVSKNYEKFAGNDVALENIEHMPKPEQEKVEYQKTTIDRLMEDPSGMLIGFAIGAASGTPIIGAPIGMVIGSALNFGFTNLFASTENLMILEVEVHEKAKKPIWYHDKGIHKKDEYSIRKYDYSEETNWKVYKTRVIVRSQNNNAQLEEELEDIAARIGSFVL